MLGGLIADDRTDGDRGIPWLMRIPVIGQLFRVDNVKSARTELIVLITPYVVNDDADARHYTEAFKTILPLLDPQLGPPRKPAYPPLIAPAGPPLWPSMEPASPPTPAPEPAGPNEPP